MGIFIECLIYVIFRLQFSRVKMHKMRWGLELRVLPGPPVGCYRLAICIITSHKELFAELETCVKAEVNTHSVM